MIALRPLPPELEAGLVRLGLVEPGTAVVGVPLDGGVSSDIWRAELAEPVCVKRALAELRVASRWTVSTDRTAFEAAWLEAAGSVAPDAVCPMIGFAAEEGVLVLRWLDPGTHPVWKQQLLAGEVEVTVAAEVGRRLAVIHAGLADPDRYPPRFESAALFRALRLDPYLRVTAERHPEMAGVLEALAERTAATATTVIHGDVSPKNILVGPAGPLLLDAECATWGDPAFDIAFCVNHLLLKAVRAPALSAPLRAAFDALTASYLAGVDWEPVADLEGRAASLVPALALARVDGASPVEYLDEAHGRPQVRGLALPLLARPPTTLAAVADRWFERVDAPAGS